MIRVNLAGTAKKKVVKAAARAAGPSKSLPMLHLLIMIGAVIGGYLWYSSLSTKTADLTAQIAAKEAEQKKLEDIIRQDAVYEARKVALESRIKIIEGLKDNQVSPVIMLDKLAEVIDNTRFVWLSSFTQNNNSISLAGTATSLDALAAFVGNMQVAGNFQNIEVKNFEDRGNVAFNMTGDFAPPVVPKPAPKEGN
jgi:Tfp pilus assembly protein PilN